MRSLVLDWSLRQEKKKKVAVKEVFMLVLTATRHYPRPDRTSHPGAISPSCLISLSIFQLILHPLPPRVGAQDITADLYRSWRVCVCEALTVVVRGTWGPLATSGHI